MTYASYTGPISLISEGEHTLKFFSTDKAGNNEQEQTINFTIQKPVDVTNQFLIEKTVIVFNRLTKKYSLTVNITNTSGQTVTGPVLLVLGNVSAGSAITNNAGLYQTNPYFVLTNNNFTPNLKLPQNIQFTFSGTVPFSFTPIIYSGSIQ
jgi:hypothetical protein